MAAAAINSASPQLQTAPVRRPISRRPRRRIVVLAILALIAVGYFYSSGLSPRKQHLVGIWEDRSEPEIVSYYLFDADGTAFSTWFRKEAEVTVVDRTRRCWKVSRGKFHLLLGNADLRSWLKQTPSGWGKARMLFHYYWGDFNGVFELDCPSQEVMLWSATDPQTEKPYQRTLHRIVDPQLREFWESHLRWGPSWGEESGALATTPVSTVPDLHKSHVWVSPDGKTSGYSASDVFTELAEAGEKSTR